MTTACAGWVRSGSPPFGAYFWNGLAVDPEDGRGGGPAFAGQLIGVAKLPPTRRSDAQFEEIDILHTAVGDQVRAGASPDDAAPQPNRAVLIEPDDDQLGVCDCRESESAWGGKIHDAWTAAVANHGVCSNSEPKISSPELARPVLVKPRPLSQLS